MNISRGSLISFLVTMSAWGCKERKFHDEKTDPKALRQVESVAGAQTFERLFWIMPHKESRVAATWSSKVCLYESAYLLKRSLPHNESDEKVYSRHTKPHLIQSKSTRKTFAVDMLDLRNRVYERSVEEGKRGSGAAQAFESVNKFFNFFDPKSGTVKDSHVSAAGFFATVGTLGALQAGQIPLRITGAVIQNKRKQAEQRSEDVCSLTNLIVKEMSVSTKNEIDGTPIHPFDENITDAEGTVSFHKVLNDVVNQLYADKKVTNLECPDNAVAAFASRCEDLGFKRLELSPGNQSRSLPAGQ